MSDWSSFEKDKAYTDQWRTFLTEKKLPKEQEEAINEGFMDLFKSAEAKDTNAAEVLDDFQQAFVDIFNKIKKRLHPDLLDDINNLEMPSDKEVAATKAPPPAADAPAADAAEDKEESEARVAAESIDRTEKFISLLKEVDTFMGVKDGNEQLQAFVTAFVLPFVKAYIEQNNKDMNNFDLAYKNYIQGLGDKKQQFTTRANFIHNVLGGDENKNEYIKDLFFQALNRKVKELPDAQPQAPETTPAEEPNQEPEAEQPNQEPEAEQPNQKPQPEKEAAQDKQLTSFSHFFDLYYSTRFGSIPSSGNVKLRSKVIRQLADLLKKGKANDTVIGMFTYLNRIYKQRERRAGAPTSEPTPDQPTAASEPTDAAAPDSEAVPDNVIYLSDQPAKGQRQTEPFLKAMRSVDGATPLELQKIKRAFKDDFEQAKFVVKEGRRKISLTKTINAINDIVNDKARNKIKKLFILLLQKYKLTADNKDDQMALSSKAPSAAASAPPEADSPDTEASASDASEPESDDDQSNDEEKEELPDNLIDLEKIRILKSAFRKELDIDDRKLQIGIPKVLSILTKKRPSENISEAPERLGFSNLPKYIKNIKTLILSKTSLNDRMSGQSKSPIEQMAISKLSKSEQAELGNEELRPIVVFLGRLGGLLGQDGPEELRFGTERQKILNAFKDIITPFVGQEYVTESMIYDRMKVLAGIK